jgi:hypothetical protein
MHSIAMFSRGYTMSRSRATDAISFNQFRDVALVRGQPAYVKILSLRSWVESGRNFSRDTFYVLIVPPTVAQAEISHYPFLAAAAP